MPPKKQKQSLADFLNDETTGKIDWADDFDDLPAAPVSRHDRGPPQRGADWLSSMPDRADRDRGMGGGPGGYSGAGGAGGFDRPSYPPREALPLPTQPPYTAFIGNLSFEVTEGDVADFFAPSVTTSVRLVTGADGRPKGFGYVEYETLDGLKDALERSGEQLNGRTVRVSVAEPRDAKSAALSSAAEEATQWRRAGPLPPSDSGMGRRGGDRPSYGRFESEGAGSGFDNMDVGPGGRSGFGSRFTPSAPREPREPRRAESLEPSVGDNASDWRTGKPVTQTQSPTPAPRRPSGQPGTEGRAPSAPRRHGDATEIDEKFASQERLGFGSKFVATPPESPSVNKRGGFGFRNRDPAAAGAAGGPSEGADTWRSARQASTPSATDAGSSAEPAQRKKLELKPRSTPLTGEGGAAPAAAASSSSDNKGSNPFGNAKPVDASEREKEIEAKMAQREKERQEEERQRREKKKAAAEKAGVEGAPTGPKAERQRGGSRAGNDKVQSPKASNGTPATGSARSSPAPKANGSPAKASGAAAAPTGAWGGGRKPSGALVNKPDQEGETASGEAAEESKPTTTDKAVEETAKAVEATSLDA